MDTSREDQRVRRFNRTCGIVALLWLLIVPRVVLLLSPRANYVDFPQFYMAGAIARAGLWDSLYPLPNPESRHNPGLPDDSQPRPAYAELAKQLGVPNGMRFIQPPPVALLFLPLSLFPYWTAWWVWIAVLGLAAWGAARYAARIFALACGRRSRWEGILMLVIATSPRNLTSIIWGNVSTFVALFLGSVTCAVLTRRQARSGLVLMLGTVVKYAPAALLPLIAAARRWRMLLWAGVSGVGFLGLSVAWMGTAPFVTYWREIVPTLGRTFLLPYSQSIYAALARLSGGASPGAVARSAVVVAQVLVLLWILWLLWKRKREDWTRPVPVFAAAAALISWFMVFGPVFWNSYSIYLAPFWGWLLWEALRSARRLALAIVIVLLAWVPWSMLYIVLFKRATPEPLDSCCLWSAVLFLGLSLWRLGRRSASGDGAVVPGNGSCPVRGLEEQAP